MNFQYLFEFICHYISTGWVIYINIFTKGISAASLRVRPIRPGTWALVVILWLVYLALGFLPYLDIPAALWTELHSKNSARMSSFDGSFHFVGSVLYFIASCGINESGTPQSGGGEGGSGNDLPKFKFSVEFPIGLHVILQLQIKKFKIACYLKGKIILINLIRQRATMHPSWNNGK